MRKLNDFLQAKHPSGLVDKTYFNANATPLIGLYNTIDVFKTDGTIVTFTDLTLIYANTVAGDLVTVNNGSHDIGDNSIQLKDGVNWLFRGNPTISSDAVAGTFYDNSVIVDVQFQGNVIITNSNGISNQIVKGYDSYIKGVRNRYTFAGTIGLSDITVSDLVNEVGDTITWSRFVPGLYYGTFDSGNPIKSNIAIHNSFTEKLVWDTSEMLKIVLSIAPDNLKFQIELKSLVDDALTDPATASLSFGFLDVILGYDKAL
jgi:hypothetical protein